MSGYLKSIPRLPTGWQSVQKPLQQAALRTMLAGIDGAAAPVPAVAGILVVEDADDMRFITVENLRRAGHAVAEAATAKEALLLAAQDAGLHLVICDVGLPDMPGGELAAELRRRCPGLKVVLMSGGPPQPGEKVLRKPFSREALLRFVEDALARDGERNA